MSSILPPSLSAALAQLDAPQRSRFTRLTEAVDEALGQLAAATASFVYPASATRHPVHRDAGETFWTAARQLQFDAPESPTEMPLLFVGYLTASRRALSRTALGFLLTDLRLVARDESTMFGDEPVARSYSLDGPMPLHGGTDAPTLVAHAWRSFSTQTFLELAATETASQLQRVLTRAVAAVMTARQDLAPDGPTERAAHERSGLATG